MYAPGVDRGEAMRLINEIAVSDIWVTLTGNINTREIQIHSEDTEKAQALIIAYICSNHTIRERLLEIIKLHNL